MPQEPYWEVMSYSEGKSASIASSSFFVSNLSNLSATAIDAIKMLDVKRVISGLSPHMKEYMLSNFAYAQALKSVELGLVGETILGTLQADYDNMMTSLSAGLGDGVGGMYSTLYETLNGTNARLQSFVGLSQRIGIDPYISRWVNSQIQPNIPDERTAWLMWRLGNISEAELKDLVHKNGWSDDWLGQLNYVWQSPLPVGMMLDMTRRKLMTVADFKWQLELSRFDENRIDGIIGLTVQYPEPYRLAGFKAQYLIDDDAYKATFAKFGLDPSWADIWASEQATFPSVSDSLVLLRRGIITEPDFLYFLGRQRYEPKEMLELIQLKDVIPPIGDLIHFAVREAFGDHNPDTQYNTMVAMAQKMGLTPEASSWYWYSHWSRIPLNLMYANYHRGLWNKDKLAYMLKITDIHPDDRQDVINVAYGPPSVRELGYGFDVGAYTADDILQARRWGGLSPENAAKSTTALIEYRLEGERNSIRTEAMYLFANDVLTEDDFRAYLSEQNTNPAAIPLWVERGQLYREKLKKPQMDTEGRIVSSSEALTAYKLGLRDEIWTRAQLKALYWTQDRIDVAILKVQHDLAESSGTVAKAKVRQLTIAQIRSFYEDGLITADQMQAQLVILGYTPENALALTTVFTSPPAKIKQPKSFPSSIAQSMYRLMMFDETDLYDNFLDEGYDEAQAGLLTVHTILIQELPDLTALYQKGVISDTDLIAELKAIGVSDTNAVNLTKKITDQFQIDRLKVEKDLTKAEIIKGAKNGVLTVTQAVNLLMDLGYGINEANYILAINKVVSAGDPEGYWDMRKVTEQLKKAGGKPYMTIPDQLITLEKQIKDLKAQLTELKTKGGNEQQIATFTIELNKLEQIMMQLITQNKLT